MIASNFSSDYWTVRYFSSAAFLRVLELYADDRGFHGFVCVTILLRGTKNETEPEMKAKLSWHSQADHIHPHIVIARSPTYLKNKFQNRLDDSPRITPYDSPRISVYERN